MCGWWSELWLELREPSWFAGVLETLVGAALALVVAAWALRRQLAADRALRVADQRARAAHVFGRALIAAAHVLDETRPADLAARFRDGSPAPASNDMYEASAAAELELDEHHAAVALWRQRTAIWRTARGAIREVEETTRTSVADVPLGNALDEVLSANNSTVHQLGIDLLRWDGTGAVPVGDVPGSFEPFGVPPAGSLNSTAVRQWSAGVERAFTEALDRWSSRH